MRALHCRLPSTPYLPFCHHSLLSLKFPFLTLPISPNQHPSLQNSHTPLGHSLRPRTIIPAPMASTPSTTEAVTEKETKPFSVLFVCLGNICRSPAAEGVFTDLVKKRGLDSNFTIDSAGTIDYHEGNEADPRMRAAAKRREIQITSLSRPIRPTDFRDFDLILAMDKQNKEDILGALERWNFKENLPADAYKKVGYFCIISFAGPRLLYIHMSIMQVRLMCSYCKKHDESEVPDPYYGGPQGFEKVLDLLEDACESLLDSILAENSRISVS
ncbi:uncharacterized protein LOC131312319 isoform X1 [Rhododendron vialii]|uniref:uncharacterized protein LOC131312319 isoform X1 n=1 Tax=Rhododendron vialii TaxID=182163 RepID=UPI00265D9BAD|nr:uncharacterized protein LOC131312319 isoform X1 [Rhododendron vialii]